MMLRFRLILPFEEQLPQLVALCFMVTRLYVKPYLAASTARRPGSSAFACRRSNSISSGVATCTFLCCSFCLAMVWSIQSRRASKKRRAAAYGSIYGTVTVTPLTGCTRMLMFLLRALLRNITSPIWGSIIIFSPALAILLSYLNPLSPCDIPLSGGISSLLGTGQKFFELFVLLIFFVPTRDGPKILRAFWVVNIFRPYPGRAKNSSSFLAYKDNDINFHPRGCFVGYYDYLCARFGFTCQ